MALDAAIPLVEVRVGQFLDHAGVEDWSGTVTFTPMARRLHIPSGDVLTETPVVCPVTAGVGAVSLVASDAPDMSRSPVQYRVTWDLTAKNGSRPNPDYPRTIYLPASVPVVDLEKMSGVVAQVPGGVGFPSGVLSTAGLTGVITAAQLRTALSVPVYPDGTPAAFTPRPTFVDLRDYGVNGLGVDEFTAKVRQACVEAGGLPIRWPAGTVVITDTLFSGGTVPRYCWRGARAERGANAIGLDPAYAATTIRFQPADTTKPMVRAYDTASPAGVLGPYEHHDLTFKFGAANGLIFGVEDHTQPTVLRPANPPFVTDGAGQKYIFGVRFERCALHADPANRNSTAGVITRTGQQMLSMAKAFETVLEDVSLWGSDVQVRTWGCDRPVFTRVRSQLSHLPFDLQSGGFIAQHSLSDVQVEGWTFSPIRTRNVEVSATGLRLEQNDGLPTGGGRFTLPGTVSVTADSTTLTFSQSMAGILFPGLSIVEVTSGANTARCLVSAVSGVTVTIDPATTLTWTAGTATAVRIHGVGPMHSGIYPAAYSDVSPGASLNCPSFVWVAARGDMAISNALAIPGVTQDIKAMVIGNHHGSQSNIAGVMSFANCSPMVVPDPSHPLVAVSGVHAPYGMDRSDFANNRPTFGSMTEEIAATTRRWAWTPKRATAAGGSNTIPLIELADEAGTTQKVWAWQVRSGGTALLLHDTTLPSVSGRRVRVRIRARSVAATGSLPWVFYGSSGGGGGTLSLTDTFQVFETVVAVPAQWQGDRLAAGTTGMRFSATDNYYVAGVTVEELTPPNVTGSRGGNAALASLLTALQAQGYIVDSTS